MTKDLLAPAPPVEPAKPGDGLVGAARGGLGNLAGATVAASAGVGVTWLVARGLGPVQAGSFFAATSAFVLVGSVARLGTSTALVYWPARLRALGRPELIGACLRSGLVPVGVLSVVLGTVLWIGAPTLFPRFSAELRVLAFFLPITALADALLAATRGYRMMRPTILLDKITRPGTQLLGVSALAGLALLTGVVAPTTDWVLAWVIPYLPVLACAAALLWRRWQVSAGRRLEERRTNPDVPAPSRQQRGEAAPPGITAPPITGKAMIDGLPPGRAFWRFTAPRALASAAQTALQRVDVLLVASLAGLAPAAAYAVAGRFIVVGQLTNGAISQAVQPRLAEMLSINDRAGASRLYQTATAWLVLLCWPLHLLVFHYADLYLRFFGDMYVSAIPAVRVLSAAMLVATGCGMVDIVLAMAGRTTWNLANVLIALTVMIIVDVLTIPALGALGAAFGLAAAVVINNLLPLMQLNRSLRLHPFGQATVMAMSLTSVSFLVVPSVAGPPPLGIGIGLGVYAAGLWVFRRKLRLDVVHTAGLR